MTVKLSELIHALDKYEVNGPVDRTVDGVEYDSRRISAGEVFVAVPGFKVDGFDFAEQAVKSGAIAVISERDNEKRLDVTWVKSQHLRKGLADLAAKFYNYPGKAMKVSGVTGTNGKTTSAFMLKNILEAKGKKVGLISSLKYDTGAEVFEAERTTPESLDMQRLLFLMRNSGCSHAVMEVSSHALELQRVEHIEFRVGLFTNLTQDHLDFHPDMHSYLNAKAKLLDKLDGLSKYAIINLDVPEFRELFGRIKSAYLSYSLNNTSADIHTTGFELTPQGTIFDVVTPLGSETVKMKLCGQFNLLNALGVIGAGLASGIDLETVLRAVEKFEGAPGRFQRVEYGQPFTVIIDYAHTPDAIERVIEAARKIVNDNAKVVAMFGCGGDRDKSKRPKMGKAASRADFVVVTSDNPRSEDPLKIIDDIKPGLGNNHTICPDRVAAIHTTFEHAQPGDIVLLLGKGAENYEITADGKHPYNEYAVAEKALMELGYASAHSAHG